MKTWLMNSAWRKMWRSKLWPLGKDIRRLVLENIRDTHRLFVDVDKKMEKENENNS